MASPSPFKLSRRSIKRPSFSKSNTEENPEPAPLNTPKPEEPLPKLDFGNPRTPTSSRRSQKSSKESPPRSLPQSPTSSPSSFPLGSYNSPSPGLKRSSSHKSRRRSKTNSPSARNGAAANESNQGAVALQAAPSHILPSIVEFPDISICPWWRKFAIKLTNLINLLETYKHEFNYVITGSSAVALLAYFNNRDLLEMLAKPDDGDIIIIPLKKPFRKNEIKFNEISLYKIGNYEIKENQKTEMSATFIRKPTSNNTFDSIDVNIESAIDYITMDGIKILSPKMLKSGYSEYLRDKNIAKRGVLTRLNASKPFNTYETDKFKAQPLKAAVSSRLSTNNNPLPIFKLD